MVAYVAIASANPHSSDRKTEVTTGRERGGNDSVGGRGGSPYNLRLPTEGLRQGHGLTVVAGAARIDPTLAVGAILAEVRPSLA